MLLEPLDAPLHGLTVLFPPAGVGDKISAMRAIGDIREHVDLPKRRLMQFDKSLFHERFGFLRAGQEIQWRNVVEFQELLEPGMPHVRDAVNADQNARQVEAVTFIEMKRLIAQCFEPVFQRLEAVVGIPHVPV